MAYTTLNTAVVAPMPNAREMTAVNENPGFLNICRRWKRTSFSKLCMCRHPTAWTRTVHLCHQGRQRLCDSICGRNNLCETIRFDLLAPQYSPGAPFLARLLREKWGLLLLHLDTNLFLPLPPVINPNQSVFGICVGPETAPGPVVRLLNQSADHGIPVDVFQLLHLFSLTPHVEVIKPALPELSGDTSGGPPALGKPQFHGLYNRRRIADPRL